MSEADDARRYRYLCAHPDWQFIERLCMQFAADSSAEFKAGMDAAIDSAEQDGGADFIRQASGAFASAAINAAMREKP